MPLEEHASFNRPPITTRLWRYMDVPKFVEMLTSGQLWLTSAEILARDDPYAGLPGPLRFPHRAWKRIDDIPPGFRQKIFDHGRRSKPDATPDDAFMGWLQIAEQRCIMDASSRPDYFINCWHAAKHESAAMWKVYAAPGAGVVIVSNGGRIATAIADEERRTYLGAVQYMEPDVIQIGLPNGFDAYVLKRSSYAYEQEVRLVHWDPSNYHDALENAMWNEETRRYDGLIEDARPLRPGVSLDCDINVLIEAVLISPYAPPWYQATIERLRDRLGHSFPVVPSGLIQSPFTVE